MFISKIIYRLQVHTFIFLFDGVANKYSFDSTWRWFGAISTIVVKEGISVKHIVKMYTTCTH